MKVFIKIINLDGVTDIFADDETKEMKLDNRNVEFDAVEFVGRVSVIVFNWKKRNMNNRIIDGERYQIKLISNDGKEKVLIGKNSFHSNYGELTKLIEEVKNYGC